MNQLTRTITAAATTAVVSLGTLGVAAVGTAGAATAPAPAATSRCIAAPKVTARAAAEIARRQQTITELESSLASAGDPYGLNGAQTQALHDSSIGLAALGSKIADTCYTDRAALAADVSSILYDHRIYALRVPQTKTIEAADHIGQARTRLGDVATKLAPKVDGDADASAHLAAMQAALAAADATLTAPPTPSGAMAEVPGLAPAKDTSASTAALQAARTQLQGTRQHLKDAETEARATVAALRD